MRGPSTATGTARFWARASASWPCVGSKTRGATAIDRLLHDAAPTPAAAIMAPSHVALGAAITVGVTGANGDLALAWIGAPRAPVAVPTPFGGLEVPFGIVLPPRTIQSDDRTFVGLSVPQTPGAVGASLHVQAATLNGGVLWLSNADSLVLH